MKHTPECIITGCELVIGGALIHGDLHQLGDTYIFNACLGPYGNSARSFVPPDPRRKTIAASPDAAFERRGVIVFPVACASFNQAALEYLNHV